MTLVASIDSFLIETGYIQAYTPEAVLAAGVERIEYITDSVSWTKEPGMSRFAGEE